MQLVHFFRPPDFCRGPFEEDEWTPGSWAADQDAEDYNRMTLRWAEISDLFHVNPWGREGQDGPGAKMAFMAAYNIDRFREFVFGSTFLKRYKVKRDLLRRLKRDDTELLKLGFSWIKLTFWGIPSKKLRPRK
jgi:hypothetical protein